MMGTVATIAKSGTDSCMSPAIFENKFGNSRIWTRGFNVGDQPALLEKIAFAGVPASYRSGECLVSRGPNIEPPIVRIERDAGIVYPTALEPEVSAEDANQVQLISILLDHLYVHTS